MRRAALLGSVMLAACVTGGSPDSDESAVPVEVGLSCPEDVGCGADPAALLGTWRIERGCVQHTDPARAVCPDSIFHAHVQAAGTISFGTEMMRFEVGTYADYSVTVPASCAPNGCFDFALIIGIPPEACAVTEDGGCHCPWTYNVDVGEPSMSYTLDGTRLFASDGSSYGICLNGDTLRLDAMSFSPVGLETMQLVRE